MSEYVPVHLVYENSVLGFLVGEACSEACCAAQLRAAELCERTSCCWCYLTLQSGRFEQVKVAAPRSREIQADPSSTFANTSVCLKFKNIDRAKNHLSWGWREGSVVKKYVLLLQKTQVQLGSDGPCL